MALQWRFLRFPGGKSKAVTFSYDDGVPQDNRLAELISSYNMKCTFNVCQPSDSSPFRNKENLCRILSMGHEIAVHGHFHQAEGIIRPIQGIREVLNSRLDLEAALGTIVRGMAYPNSGIRCFYNGTNYETIKNYLTELDIAYSRSLGGDNNRFELPQDWHNWIPTVHHNNPNTMDYIDEFLAIDTNNLYQLAPRLFYIWGHSYEFDNNNNWDLIENICEKISGKEEIWYATNIEIHDYVEAYHSLRYSADESIVHNPTATDVWFTAYQKVFLVKAGETIRIEQ